MNNNTEINAYWSALGNCRQGPVIASIDGLFAIPFSFFSVLSFPFPFFLSFYLLCYSSDLITFLIFPVDKL